MIWRIGLAATAEIATLPAAAFGFGDIQFTEDGRRLLATAGQGSIAMWDVATKRRLRQRARSGTSPMRSSIVDRK